MFSSIIYCVVLQKRQILVHLACSSSVLALVHLVYCFNLPSNDPKVRKQIPFELRIRLCVIVHEVACIRDKLQVEMNSDVIILLWGIN